MTEYMKVMGWYMIHQKHHCSYRGLLCANKQRQKTSLNFQLQLPIILNTSGLREKGINSFDELRERTSKPHRRPIPKTFTEQCFS